jgi:hypothetical protein
MRFAPAPAQQTLPRADTYTAPAAILNQRP